MKILEVKEDKIIFNNGKELTYDHEQDCCEYNYADFSQLEEEAMNYKFDDPLDFESVDSGFRFGNKNKKMFFVPCYSEQNGCYTRNLNIYYGGEKVIETEAEWKEW